MGLINLKGLFDGAEKAVTKEGFLHIWPEIYDCEGFFLGSVEKKTCKISRQQGTVPSSYTFKSLDEKTLIDVCEYYQQHFGFDLYPLTSSLRIHCGKREQQIWLFPEFADQLIRHVRVQRSGIRICDLIASRKGNLIKTNHEFVTCFGKHFSTNVLELNASQAAACYQGKNIDLTMADNVTAGEVVMRFQGSPLGLGKLLIQAATRRIKNNLPRSAIRINARFTE